MCHCKFIMFLLNTEAHVRSELFARSNTTEALRLGRPKKLSNLRVVVPPFSPFLLAPKFVCWHGRLWLSAKQLSTQSTNAFDTDTVVRTDATYKASRIFALMNSYPVKAPTHLSRVLSNKWCKYLPTWTDIHIEYKLKQPKKKEFWLLHFLL